MHLPQQHAFGDESDPGRDGGDIFEPDLVTDFVAEPDAAFVGDARGEQTGREAARLEDDDLAVARAIRDRAASAGPAWICPSRSAPG